MKHFTVRDLALIASMSAIVVLSSAIYLVYFMLIVLTLCLKKVHMYLVAIISAIINWWLFLSSNELLINIIFWPLLVLIIRLNFSIIFNVKKGDPLVITDKSRSIYLFVISLISILTINLIGAFINGLLFSSVEASLIAGLWFYTIQGFISALLVLFLGFYLQKRISAILLKTGVKLYEKQ